MEKFDKFWDDDADAWMYKDAVRADINNESKIVHESCFLRH